MVAGLALAVLASGLPAAAKDADLPYIVIEEASGDILLQNRPFDRWYPASLSKLMTEYVALRAKAAGEISDGSPVTISKYAASQPPSALGVKPGGSLRFDSALKILVVKSANDIAVAIAKSVAGSVPAFVERMNAEAKRLGMNQTHFANPNGLHSPDQYTSARDIAVLARRIFEEFPKDAQIFSVPAIRVAGEVHYSYNLLLERFAGADGMKTGFVCASGYNIIASATRNGRHLIAVVAGAFSQADRATTAAKLLLDGFADANSGPSVEAAVPANPPAPARSLRATMCSEKARKERYDPGAGEAVIEFALPGGSPHQPRTAGSAARRRRCRAVGGCDIGQDAAEIENTGTDPAAGTGDRSGLIANHCLPVRRSGPFDQEALAIAPKTGFDQSVAGFGAIVRQVDRCQRIGHLHPDACARRHCRHRLARLQDRQRADQAAQIENRGFVANLIAHRLPFARKLGFIGK